MTRPLLRVAPGLAQPPLLGGLSTRIGFPAADAANDEATRIRSREILAHALGRSADDCAWAKQVHGKTVLQVDAPGYQGEGDALVTVDQRWILLASVADCSPILLWSKGSPARAVVHAGWRGFVAGVLGDTVATLQDLGAESSGLRAWIGPCISARKFEVGLEVATQFDEEFVTQAEGEKPHVDLRSAVRRQLEQCGIDARRIAVAGDCTYEQRDLYWSYRRDGGIEGRHLAYLASV